MKWTVTISRKVRKDLGRLPESAIKNLIALIREIEVSGPVRGNWSNYSSLGQGRHHCHIKKGRPTYVAVWEVRDKEIRLVEIVYAGTHENAPY
jgi:mRNA-degrading endonuclease RelE of RelBE toxin-antitoxin system